MFNNVGSKIKLLAKVIMWIGIIISILVPLLYFSNAKELYDSNFMILLCFVFFLFVPLFIWGISIILYGYGELVDKVNLIYEQSAGYGSMSLEQIERLERIKDTRRCGLITEEECLQAMKNENEHCIAIPKEALSELNAAKKRNTISGEEYILRRKDIISRL